MTKYYIGTGTIGGRKVRTGHIMANFRGEVEEAAEIIARANPGIEDLEITENGDDVNGMIKPLPEPNRDLDFAEAMMSQPRTARPKRPSAVPATPPGQRFNPNSGKLPGQVDPQQADQKTAQ